MEEGAADGPAPSQFQRSLCNILVPCKIGRQVVGVRWWTYLLLCLLLTSSSSLLVASSHQVPQKELRLSRPTFVREGNPAIERMWRLIGEVGDYQGVGPGGSESATAGLQLKEVEDHPLPDKVASGDEDFENVGLSGKEEEGQDGDGKAGLAIESRRRLIGEVGDYQDVGSGDSESLAAGLQLKEGEDHPFPDKFRSGDEDLENVGLSGKEEEGQDGDGKVGGEGKKEVAAVSVDDEQKKKAEHTGVEKFLDRLEESLGKEEDGRFNKSIAEQDGVLETVARVGGHLFDEEEEEEQPSDEGIGVLGRKDGQIADGGSKEGTKSHEEAGKGRNSTDPGEADVTWFDKIMGQSDQPHKSDSSHALGKESSRNAARNHSVVIQKKNGTREKVMEDNAGYHQVEDVQRLIDREDNTYVISNPGKNRMMLQEDLTLISDIVMVIAAAALGGTICGLLGQPVILGYLVAGMVVGPGGLHLVHELVQVETLAQFGVVFLLFVLGVEFNPSKMQGIHNVSLGGGCLQIGIAMLLGGLLGSSIPQGVFIGAFLSMSSTAVVVKCLMDSKMGGTEHGQIMLGTLILQDCALGLLLAVMPALAAKGSDGRTFALALSRAALLLLLFCGSAWVLAKLFIPRFLRGLVQLTKFNSELFLLGAIGLCLSFALISQSLGLSLEVGAFVGGLVLSGGIHTEKTLHQVEPIRNVFAALFLSSIGMVMHPIFLWEHIDILMASLGVVFLGKICLFAGVVRIFGYSSRTSVSVGIALAQIGEFAFILLSRAQGLGLVSRKLYLLLMGTSALSLVLTPFAFKIVIRLNPVGSGVLRKGGSKPVNIHEILDQEVVNEGFPSTTGSEEGAIPPYWSLSNPDNVVNDGVGSESVHGMLSSELQAKEEHVESIDMEEGRGDRPSSPARVLFRRPYNQSISGKWNEWRNELEATETYDQRR